MDLNLGVNMQDLTNSTQSPAATYILAYQLLLGYSESSKTVLQGIFPDRDQSLLQGSNI